MDNRLTPTQRDAIEGLPLEVQQTLENYPSVVQNYIIGQLLPRLNEGHKYNLYEVYYDCAATPTVVVKNEVLTTNERDSDRRPTIVEAMGDDGVVFIEVNGHTPKYLIWTSGSRATFSELPS